MKKVLFTVLVLVMCATLTQAQDFAKRGVIEAGGSISFTSTTAVSDGETADDSHSAFSFMPAIGYFIIDGLELGLLPVFRSSSFGDASQTDLGIYFAPQYHFDLKSSIYPFVGAMVGYNSTNIDDGTNDATYSGISYGGLAGIKVQVGKAALVNIGVNYFMFTYNPEDWDGDRNGSNEFGISAGFSIFFGR